MRPVQREEILDFATYTDQRDTLRPPVLQAKSVRRATLGEHLTLLFENHLTVWYQIQEMMRVERIVRESDIRHEIETYNELLGGPGELGACLLISIQDAAVRNERLAQWRGLLPTLYLELEDGTKVPPTWDERQIGDDRLSAVQYIKFDVGGQVPVALGSDLADPAIYGRAPLPAAVRAALAEDLAE